MSDRQFEEAREFWDDAAGGWELQVADEGDMNRLLNSDPVLWAFAGDVSGLDVLDAGCGTGYLSRKLRDAGARVTGVDFSAKMIEIARARNPGIDFRVDSVSELSTAGDARFDLVVSNYVIMDTPDLEGTARAFARVLRPGGAAVVVFSHPCFPQGRATVSGGGGEVSYRWDFSYFERRKCTDAPWGHFKSDFIWFHRPLSDYWKAFAAAGLAVEGFEEPRVTEERFHLAPDELKLRDYLVRPFSVAFKLRKGR
jgi:SAM-dependent methyltransferase